MKKASWTMIYVFLSVLMLQVACTSNESESISSYTEEDTSLEEVLPVITADTFTRPVPTPMRSDVFLGYEIYLNNYAADGYVLESVDILDTDQDGAVLRTYAGEELEECLIPFNPDRPIFGIVVLLWPTFESTADVPATLAHRLTFTNPDGEMIILEKPQVFVSEYSPAVISPPVAGENWQAINGPSNFDRHHRNAFMSFRGDIYMSQRFAVDWMQLGPDGYLFSGDGSENTDYYCYGTELLAVADGVVIDCRDGIPEHRVDEGMPIPTTCETVAGNYVILDIGNGLYPFYAHLQPGTMTVRIGDEVRNGDVIGLLGNTGNSTAPHLHFHLADATSILTGQGVPYVLDSYELQGTVPVSVDSQFTKEYVWTENDFPDTVERRFFGHNDVVNFP